MKLKLRHIIQILFFLLIALIAINHTLAESGNPLPIIGSASLHAICPFGGVVSIYQFITTGTFVKKIHESSFALFYIVLALSVLFGPVFCSWMCPLGSLQEWLSKLGKQLGVPQIKLDLKFDKPLRLVRYLVLAIVLVNTALAGTLVFTNYDPYYALFNFWTEEFIWSSGLVLLAVLMMNLFIERAWCKYACPMGAMLGVTNKFRIFKLRRQASTCISCTLCDQECPMDIKVMTHDIITDTQCISCMACTSEEICPVNDTVSLKIWSHKKGLSSRVLGISIILLITTGLLTSMASGYWSTESSKEPVRLESGDYNLEDIRGSYGFIDISDLFDIPIETLSRAFMIPKSLDISTFKNKDLEGLYKFDALEIGNGSVKLFVAMYTDISYDYENSGDYLPLSARVLLDQEGRLNNDESEYLNSHTIDLEANSEQSMLADTPVTESHSDEYKVNGSTTFKMLLDWGLSEDLIDQTLGLEMPGTNFVVKDFCQKNSISFGDVKTSLQNSINILHDIE